MPETVLDYDKIIWEVFAIGIVSSTVILYNVIKDKSEIPPEFHYLALSFGFAILLYSFILFRGYNTKKDALIKIDYDTFFMSNELEGKFYFRVRWMAESIVIGLMLFYIYYFYPQLSWFFFHINLFRYFNILNISLFFASLCLLANILSKIKKEKR